MIIPDTKCRFRGDVAARVLQRSETKFQFSSVQVLVGSGSMFRGAVEVLECFWVYVSGRSRGPDMVARQGRKLLQRDYSGRVISGKGKDATVCSVVSRYAASGKLREQFGRQFPIIPDNMLVGK